MSTLEFNGEQNQRNYAQMGNISASNDPLQQGYDETAQLIKGAQVIGAGRELGLDDDTTLKLAARKQKMDERRQQQRRNRGVTASPTGRVTQRATQQGPALPMQKDQRLSDIDANERRFQKESPQRAADPLELLQLGADEADLQQIRSGRIENILQVDQAGGGEGGRDRRRLQQQIKDRQALNIMASIPTAKGQSVFLTDSVPAGRPIPEDMREAAMLQEQGLAFPERTPARYKKDKKSGKSRRNFGRPLKDADGNVISERMTRVKRARESGQLQDPDDIMSQDKFTTPRASGYIGIADDGPEGPRSPMMASQRAGNAEFARLVEAVNSGQVQLTDQVAPGRTVKDLLNRMAQEQSGGFERQMMKDEVAMARIQDTRTRKENNRRILRQVAVEAQASGEPLTRTEAETLLQRLEADNTAADSKRKAERQAIGNIGSFGSTKEVIGDAVNLDMPSAVPFRDNQGNIAGYRSGADIIGFADDVDLIATNELLNARTPQERDLINFISQTMDQPETGGVPKTVIGEATQDFTDRVSKLRSSRFGEQVKTVPTGIRSIAEAQQLVDSLIDTGLANNAKFSRYNPDNPNQPTRVPRGERPTMLDLMSTLRMEKHQNQKLANALYQLALAEGMDVNQERKAAYASRTGSYAPVTRPEGFSGQVNLELQRRGTPAVDLPRTNITFNSQAGKTPGPYFNVTPAKINNSQRARLGEIEADGQAKNINLQPALRALSEPDAAEPSIGLLPGETGNLRYRKGFGRDDAGELKDYVTGYTELERKRSDEKNPYSQRKVDVNIEIAKAVEDRMAADAENRSVQRIMRQADSAAFDDRMRAQDAGDYQQSLKNEQFEFQKIGAPQRSVTTTQPTRPAQVAPSIAPDPWAATGPADETQLPADLKAELNSLNNPATAEAARRTQGPTMREGGARTRQQRIDQLKNFGIKNRKTLTYGALGAGTSAVLAGILGGGQEDERSMYR